MDNITQIIIDCELAVFLNNVCYQLSFTVLAGLVFSIHFRKNTFHICTVIFYSLLDTIYTERFMGLPTPQDNLAGYMVNFTRLNLKIVFQWT